MDKLKMHTPNLSDEKFAALAEMFPNAVTETVDENGAVNRAIDKDVLMQEINAHVVGGREERYQFTWPDKRKSVLLANAPIAAALRPCREESVDFDNTENLYIEGDNLDVLKLLRETYLNRVKMIYIDPPYNTGNDFVYEDNFVEDSEEFLCRDGQYDELGNRLVANPNSNGRFHTDWLNMMYPRLRVARDILTDDGLIFISIDDNEVHNLRKICDEIFGKSNFIGCAGRISKKANNQGDYWAPNFDYLLTYARNIEQCPAFFGGMNVSSYNLIEESGPRKGEKYQLVRLYMTSLDPMRGCTNQRYYIECPDGTFIIPPGENFPEKVGDGEFIPPKSGRDKVWRWSYQSYLGKKDSIVVKEGRSSNVVGVDGAQTKWNAFTKTYLNDVIEKQTSTPNSFIENHINQNASHELKKLGIPFPFVKPSSLMKYLAEICQVKDGDIVLDFFSGSASTADSLMQLNAQDGGRRKFVMVQLPEVVKEEDSKDIYDFLTSNGLTYTIPEIGKERIRRAGQKIKDESGLTAQDLDIGFRVLKLDSSNMKDVYYTPEELAQAQFDFDSFADNIKDDRSSEDLLFQVMLELGIPLSAKITQVGSLLCVNDNYLIACFDKLDTALITEIAKKKPYYAVFRDSSFLTDSAMVNFEQVFNTYSPNTIRRVL